MKKEMVPLVEVDLFRFERFSWFAISYNLSFASIPTRYCFGASKASTEYIVVWCEIERMLGDGLEF